MYLEAICNAVKSYYPEPNLDPIKAAYEFAFQQHQGHVRASGEPYFSHLAEVTLLVCQLKLDIPSVVAALLHDIIEDTEITRDELALKFGTEVADIVDGVSKLTRIEGRSKEENQAESFRKMLLAMAKDIRVILVKLCDRLHNMRTLNFCKEDKQRRVAQETKEIYAPLANRLGIHWLKSELEDLCLLYLRPEIYQLIKEKFENTSPERDAFIEDTGKEIKKVLEESGVSASVTGRAKHFYSVWQKMEKKNLAFEEIYDLLGFRVIVPSLRACYETLGIIHATWKPVPDRFKDYIAMPKPNMYQSLHTTVIGPKGTRIEVQIRTPDMNTIAEEGIAAHWRYKEHPRASAAKVPEFDLKWVKELVETQQYLRNPDEFIQSVKGELFPEEVFVFTPKGDLVRLPFRSTPVDFAYAVHSDVGHRAVGAKVNGQIVPLDYRLQNGDAIEILTSRSHVPSKDWLKFIVSNKAKQRVRAFLRAEERSTALALGMDLLSRDLRKVKQSLKKLEKAGKILEVAQNLGLKTESDLYVELGYGKIHVTRILPKLLPEGEEIKEEEISRQESPLVRIFQRAAHASQQKVGVRVGGLADVVVRFAKCCDPLPGDRIVGFITRSRGVTVHHANCSEVYQNDSLRKVDVDWDTETSQARKIKITVYSQDQLGLLANMSQAITAQGANICSAHCRTSSSGKAKNIFEIIVKDSRQLDKVKRAIEMVPGVTKVERIIDLRGHEEADVFSGAEVPE